VNFCSRTAGGEALAGTAVRGTAYVFLPVAKRYWRGSELNLSWASRAELDAIRAARKVGLVTRLYNPAGEEEEVLTHVPPGAGDPEGLDAFLSLFAPRWPRRAAAGRRFAVCTHGTRDRCCAKWGFAVFREALELYEAGASPFAPIECSHLGGDRFAATGVVFPSGGMYAHLDSADLAALLQAEAEGSLLPAHYRGCVFEPQLVQIVRAGLAREGLVVDARTPIAVEWDGEGPATARAGEARFAVELKRTEVAFFGSCTDLERGRRSTVQRTVFLAARRL